jgi:predicted RNA-binding protein with PUA-like domain
MRKQMHYWLMKSEPDTFSIDDLKNRKHEPWNGVRNYQVRNMILNDMSPHDLAFFYHSNCKIPGIVGIMEIISTAYPDLTAQDPTSPYFDPKSSKDNPRWYCVDVRFVEKFSEIVTLESLRHMPKLKNMPLLRKGNRLSITPVQQPEWEVILSATRHEHKYR